MKWPCKVDKCKRSMFHFDKNMFGLCVSHMEMLRGVMWMNEQGLLIKAVKVESSESVDSVEE